MAYLSSGSGVFLCVSEFIKTFVKVKLVAYGGNIPVYSTSDDNWICLSAAIEVGITGSKVIRNLV